ncbi:TPA: dTDP-4-dehydrorhamnose reductase [Providencia rettgeri]|uniref:dTDP-4-dehydrorhamnose reductase n=1 Tax=Providencia sp. PROV141 TaxID=2949851 RepID=UPI001B99E6F5|nr:dTDP-4-dehydrorhamnose reductase [Providencia sp. PROV141]HBC7429871.1 dTDP-4-dehydrorhamnose reductase [Providencia rettgeri]
MRVLVTGSKGQVGHCLEEQLTNKTELLALDSTQLDITDKAAVFRIISEFKPNIIINAAAYTAVDRAEREIKQSENINIKGPEYLAKAAHHIGAAILHISTDYVFGGDKELPYTENDITNPKSVYGQTKLNGEVAVINSCPRHIILRTSWVFSQHGNNFVKTMLRLAAERTNLSIVSDQYGGPTDAADIASTLINLAERIHYNNFEGYGIYHYSGFPYVSWYEFAQYIFEQATNKKIILTKPLVNAIKTTDYPTTAMRPHNSRLDLTKIQLLGINASNWQLSLQQIEKYKK